MSAAQPTRIFPQPEILLHADQKRILALLRSAGALSRQELAQQLNINSGVMTRYCRELMTLGLLLEEQQVKAVGRGRPSLPLALHGPGAYAIGIAKHPGWVDMALVNLRGEIKATVSFASDTDTPQALAAEINAHLPELTAKLNLFRSKFLGFGLSVPGYAKNDPRKRHVVEQLATWRDEDLDDVFSQALGAPVWIDNDANAAALGECYVCHRPAVQNMLLLYISYGVGGASVLDGQVYRGSHFNAGEIGALYPLGQPRPSALDLVEHLQGRGFEATPLAIDLSDAAVRNEVDLWCTRAAQQLYLAVLSGIAWLDPQAIMVAGIIAPEISAMLTEKLATMDWQQVAGERPLPSFYASSNGHFAAAVGAATLPIHDTIAP